MYLQESFGDSIVVSEMKERGRANIYSKWGKRLQPIHYAALLLDPRGKHSPAIPQVDKDSGKYVIQDLLKLFEGCSNTTPVEKKNSEQSSFEFYQEAEQPHESETELDKYLKEPVAFGVKTPLQLLEYWKIQQKLYPNLARVGRIVLAIPASSATSERCFSDAGFTINIRRSSLDPDNLNKLLFIRSIQSSKIFDEE